MKTSNWSRRQVLGAGLALATTPRFAIAAEREYMMSKTIPSSGESLPVIGLGTYNVFDVESTAAEIDLRRKIVGLLTQSGGSLLDTSPMYNRSEKVIGDIVNSGTDVPDWAREYAHSWGQFFLKFIISHPAVTCVIPATSKTRHMIDNLGAGMGILPDKAMRKRMSDFFTSI